MCTYCRFGVVCAVTELRMRMCVCVCVCVTVGRAAGWLRPGVNITAALHDHSTDFRHLERGAIAFFARIVAIAACACALAATVAAAVLRALFS